MGCGIEEKFLEPMPPSSPRHGPGSFRKPVNQGFLDGVLVGLESGRECAWPRSEDSSAGVATMSADLDQNSAKDFRNIAMAPDFWVFARTSRRIPVESSPLITYRIDIDVQKVDDLPSRRSSSGLKLQRISTPS